MSRTQIYSVHHHRGLRKSASPQIWEAITIGSWGVLHFCLENLLKQLFNYQNCCRFCCLFQLKSEMRVLIAHYFSPNLFFRLEIPVLVTHLQYLKLVDVRNLNELQVCGIALQFLFSKSWTPLTAISYCSHMLSNHLVGPCLSGTLYTLFTLYTLYSTVFCVTFYI